MKIDKAAIKSEFQRHDRDTGSSEVQIAILTKEIEALTEYVNSLQWGKLLEHTLEGATK